MSKKGIKLFSEFSKLGYVILDLDKESLKDLKVIKRRISKLKIKKKSSINKQILHLQNSLYKSNFHKNVLKRNLKKITQIVKVKKPSDISITSFIHLRHVKKTKKNRNFIGFHRETFYSDFPYTKYQINISIPLLNYDVTNSMKIIEKSHKIPDNKIKTKKLNSEISGIKRYSVQHKLGLPYNPKVITSGVNLNKSIRAKLKTNQFIIFSGQLIHGNGSNNKLRDRYSIDFGLINNKYLKGHKIKNHSHVSFLENGKYWEMLKFNN